MRSTRAFVRSRRHGRGDANDQPLLRDHDPDVLQEHGVRHFHARYGGQIAVFTIESIERIRGQLPRRADRLVREWAGLHRLELMRNWEQVRAGKPLAPIEPLK